MHASKHDSQNLDSNKAPGIASRKLITPASMASIKLADFSWQLRYEIHKPPKKILVIQQPLSHISEDPLDPRPRFHFYHHFGMQRIKEKRDDGHVPSWVGFKNLDVLCQQFPIVIYSIYYVYIYTYIIYLYWQYIYLLIPSNSTAVHSASALQQWTPLLRRHVEHGHLQLEPWMPWNPRQRLWHHVNQNAGKTQYTRPSHCHVQLNRTILWVVVPESLEKNRHSSSQRCLFAPGENNPWQNQTRLDGCLDTTKSEFQIFIGLKANDHPTSWSGCVLLPNPAASHLGMFLMLALPWSTRSLSLQKNEASLHHTVQVPIAKRVPAIFSKLFARAWRIFVSSWSLWARSDNLKVLEAGGWVGESTKLRFCTKLDRFVFKKQVHTFKSLRPGCESCTQDWKMVKTPCLRKHLPSW